MEKNDLDFKKMVGLSKKMTNDEFITFRNLIKEKLSDMQLKELNDAFSKKIFQFEATDNSMKLDSASILYKKHFDKITSILQNEELRKKIGNTNILFYGETGTGKTTIVKKLIALNQNFTLVEKSFENLLSAKMGQTQLNLMSLANNLIADYKNKNIILFIDELDSIINSRSISNDVAEHGRIVATFIKFIDSLPSNIVLFAATNMIETIDDAVLRRFNIKVEGIKFDKKMFFEFFEKETTDSELFTTFKINQMIKITDDGNIFCLSDLKEFQKNLEIEKTIDAEHLLPRVYINQFIKRIDLSKGK